MAAVSREEMQVFERSVREEFSILKATVNERLEASVAEMMATVAQQMEGANKKFTDEQVRVGAGIQLGLDRLR